MFPIIESYLLLGRGSNTHASAKPLPQPTLLTPSLLFLSPSTPAPLPQDNAAVFPIIESYLLLGAAAALTPLSQAIQVSLEKTVLAVTQAVVESMRGTTQSGQQSQPQVSGS